MLEDYFDPNAPLEDDAKSSHPPQSITATPLGQPSKDDTLLSDQSLTLSSTDEKPKATVVIVFHNELFSSLMRSAISVINRAPDWLLDELILVDDLSDLSVAPELGEKLENFVKYEMKKTKLLRLRERGGLMNARTWGARAGTGEYLVFLDSHIECMERWLEPLVKRMMQHVRSVWG